MRRDDDDEICRESVGAIYRETGGRYFEPNWGGTVTPLRMAELLRPCYTEEGWKNNALSLLTGESKLH
jgi:hypothetical protein